MIGYKLVLLTLNWSKFDFILAGVLLSVLIGLILVVKRIKNKTHKKILIAVILLAFILLWMELAVGVFGSPIAGD